MLHRRSYPLSIAVMLAWIGLTAGCSNLPLPAIPPSVTAPSSGSGSSSFGASSPPASSQFTVTPTAFSFPDTAIGSTASTNAVATLTGTGAAIQLVAITSSNPSEFPLTTTCSVPGTIAPSTTCLVSVQFKPNAAGTRAAQIAITTTNASAISLAVSGLGVPSALPQITITPESFSFPNTVVGSTSFTGGVVTLTNTGTIAIGLTTITSLDVNEFPITTTCNLPGSLAPGASCTVLVQFRPGFGGNRSGQMVIATTNAGTGTFSVFGVGM